MSHASRSLEARRRFFWILRSARQRRRQRSCRTQESWRCRRAVRSSDAATTTCSGLAYATKKNNIPKLQHRQRVSFFLFLSLVLTRQPVKHITPAKPCMIVAFHLRDLVHISAPLEFSFGGASEENCLFPVHPFLCSLVWRAQVPCALRPLLFTVYSLQISWPRRPTHRTRQQEPAQHARDGVSGRAGGCGCGGWGRLPDVAGTEGSRRQSTAAAVRRGVRRVCRRTCSQR